MQNRIQLMNSRGHCRILITTIPPNSWVFKISQKNILSRNLLSFNCFSPLNFSDCLKSKLLTSFSTRDCMKRQPSQTAATKHSVQKCRKVSNFQEVQKTMYQIKHARFLQSTRNKSEKIIVQTEEKSAKNSTSFPRTELLD